MHAKKAGDMSDRRTAVHGSALQLRSRWGNEIVRKPIKWLWKPYLRRRALNLITGEPGVGKSTLICELAAILSTGRPWPGETLRREPVNVWIMNGEDSAEDTIAWRLDNQFSDKDRV